jgi:NADH-quinone oxidoreductase subunit G
LTAFKPQAFDYADVLLPIAPFAETAGSFVNMEGRLQSFHGAVKPQGEARPAWKVLRVLGNLLSLNGFDYDSVEAVRADVLPEGQASIDTHLDNSIGSVDLVLGPVGEGLERLGETAMYQLDPLTRRAASLQKTPDAASPMMWVHGDVLVRLQLDEGNLARVRQGEAEAVLPVWRDDRLAVDVIRVPAAFAQTASLGARLGSISVEKL